MEKIFKDKWKRYLFMGCLVLFVVIFGLFLFDLIYGFDVYIHSLIIKLNSNYVTYFFKFITFFSSTYFIIFGVLLSLLLIKKKKTGMYIALNAGLCCLINQAIKFIVARPRPININMVEESGFSFPSGHSMMSVAFYGLLIYFISQKKWKKSRKILLSSLLMLLIFLIGVSRIYLGVHFASDVLAGFALATAYLLLFIELVFKKKKTNKVR